MRRSDSQSASKAWYLLPGSRTIQPSFPIKATPPIGRRIYDPGDHPPSRRTEGCGRSEPRCGQRPTRESRRCDARVVPCNPGAGRPSVTLPGPPGALWALALVLWALVAVVTGEAVRIVSSRWVPLWRSADPLERGILDLYLGGAVLYLVAALPIGAFTDPVVFGIPIVAAGALVILVARLRQVRQPPCDRRHRRPAGPPLGPPGARFRAGTLPGRARGGPPHTHGQHLRRESPHHVHRASAPAPYPPSLVQPLLHLHDPLSPRDHGVVRRLAS